MQESGVSGPDYRWTGAVTILDTFSVAQRRAASVCRRGDSDYIVDCCDFCSNEYIDEAIELADVELTMGR